MNFFKKENKPYLIAGPCSAETREQVWATASALQPMGIDLFRAGVWKPRTRPGTFEGNGVEALGWLNEMKEALGLRVAVEVAETVHIEEALKHGIDVLWVGARTTVNPFQVQKLADALKGVQIPVMIKNPVTPDVDLWLGAIERMEVAGITDIAAIHRGFSSYQASAYRNAPNWLVPIELKRRRRDLPIFCDPSHIGGKRDKVAEIAQKALDMHFDGLMIETHPDPDNAWSDAAQQITPAALQNLLSHLIIRQQYTADMTHTVELEYLRGLMDTLDAEIVELLARRMEISERVGWVKKECNMTAYQPDRWREIVATRTEKAKKMMLSEDFIIELYEKIHHESIKKQLEVLQSTTIALKK
jgi:chorismate mutase